MENDIRTNRKKNPSGCSERGAGYSERWAPTSDQWDPSHYSRTVIRPVAMLKVYTQNQD